MSNRFYTILVVPEKTSEVRRVVLPSWVLKSAAVSIAFLVLVAGVMVFDYWYVMSEISENRALKLENRKLRQQVQIFQNKMTAVEATMDRIKTFATRLKVILHVEDHPPTTNLQGKIPEAALPRAEIYPVKTVQSSTSELTASASSEIDPELAATQKEHQVLESKISQITREAFATEELLQDQYEILFDKKSFLAALPTRQPAPGYFTSGFGVRTSPYGDRVKMHEGLDIANRPGTLVRAPADGEVVFSSSKAGYGMTLILDHGYGIETWYGHLKNFVVKKGDRVKRGTKIALLGNSGRSTGPHVHYEVRVHGYPVDPRSYIFEDSSP